nr:FtsK/SpoIIIE domain-containing protein [Microbacterium sp. RG1]
MLEHLPIGLASDARGEAVTLDLVSEASHILVQGQTRSGKSAFVMRLLAAALDSSSVVVAGADPSGVLLNPLRDHLRPDWRSITGADIGAHVAALDAVVAELDRRLRLLLELEQDKIETFTPDVPLVLVVLEEYPGLIAAAEDDDAASGRRAGQRFAPAIRRNVSRLVRESAKVGFRIVTIAQRADAAVLGGNERSNYAVRVTLRVDNQEAVRMLHPFCPAQLADAVHTFPQGVGLYQGPGRSAQRVDFPSFTYASYLGTVRGGMGPSRAGEVMTR